MNLTKYQPRNQDEQAIIESRPNRIANIEPKDAFRNVLNVISNIFPLHGIDGDLTFYSTVTKEIVKTFGQIAANEIEIAFASLLPSPLTWMMMLNFMAKQICTLLAKY
jgi:hypothetical protein